MTELEALRRHAAEEYGKGYRDAAAYVQGMGLGYDGPGWEYVKAFALKAVLGLQDQAAAILREAARQDRDEVSP